MTADEVRNLPLGVYRLHWASGGSSVAAVGQLHDGSRWIAPANWTSREPHSMGAVDWWDHIDRVELITTE